MTAPCLPHEAADACETIAPPSPGPLALICEHASARIPAPLATTASDRAWLDTHWAYDIGAREITLGIAEHTGSSAVLARFSRLVCDPNRHPARPDLVRATVEGAPLSFNQDLSPAEVARRVRSYHAPYHRAVDRVLAERLRSPEPVLLLSIHSFTPIWAQRLRTMDIGVLYDGCEDEAAALQRELEAEGFFVAPNAPYSGRGTGLMYAAARHGEAHGVAHLELEFNQALICTPERCRRVAGKVSAALLRLSRS